MSRPRSTARDAERAACSALRHEPAVSGPAFASLREAGCGRAAAVLDPRTREFSFWIVPFILRGRACGRAMVDGAGRVQSIGTFGAGAGDEAACPPASFFDSPPAPLLDEVRRAYPGAAAADPMLSFDGTPAKWGWLLAIPGPPPVQVFIGPHGWYVARPGRGGEG